MRKGLGAVASFPHLGGIRGLDRARIPGWRRWADGLHRRHASPGSGRALSCPLGSGRVCAVPGTWLLQARDAIQGQRAGVWVCNVQLLSALFAGLRPASLWVPAGFSHSR